MNYNNFQQLPLLAKGCLMQREPAIREFLEATKKAEEHTKIAEEHTKIAEEHTKIAEEQEGIAKKKKVEIQIMTEELEKACGMSTDQIPTTSMVTQCRKRSHSDTKQHPNLLGGQPHSSIGNKFVPQNTNTQERGLFYSQQESVQHTDPNSSQVTGNHGNRGNQNAQGDHSENNYTGTDKRY